MKIITEYPFENYNGYIITNRENRKMICLRDKNTKKRTTISYARYLISVRENRLLNKYEQVDHIDNNKTNDDIDNLQVLSLKDNIRKYYIQSSRTRKMIRLICPNCKKEFTRELNNCHLQKGNSFSSCSRKCLYNFLKAQKTKEQLIRIGEDQIIEIFRKKY